MKRVLLPFLLLPLCVSAQTLVSTSPQQRTALLEEFTAINCGNCPGGHAVADALQTQHGSDVTVIGVHGGSLANPSASQPDFRTTDGSALWSLFSVFGQPTAVVNRGPVQSSSSWAGSVQSVLSQASPVNIGVSSTYFPGTGLIGIEVELYYTGTGLPSDDRIHVALTEDHIIGWQTDYQNGNQPNYDHKHVLRDMVTSISGDLVTTTTMGTLVQRSYSILPDPNWNINELNVVAYVSEENGEVYQAKEVDADGGITTGIESGAEQKLLGTPYPIPATEQVSIPLISNEQSRTIRVYDVNARLVLTQQIPAATQEVKLDVQSLDSGTYVAKMEGAIPVRIQVMR